MIKNGVMICPICHKKLVYNETDRTFTCPKHGVIFKAGSEDLVIHE